MAKAQATTDPQTRLTKLSAEMIEAFEASPLNHPDDTAIVLLDSERRSGSAFAGLDGPGDAAAMMLWHLNALLEATGGALLQISVDGSEPQTLKDFDLG